MKLYLVETDNGLEYEDNSRVTFIVLAYDSKQAKAIVKDAPISVYGHDWDVNNIKEITDSPVSWNGMPTMPTILY